MQNTPASTELLTGKAAVEARRVRGMEIAATVRVTKKGEKKGFAVWTVPSQTGHGSYSVILGSYEPHCTCPDHETRGCKCKHIFAVEYTMKREEKPDGTTTVSETLTVKAASRKTYPQNWPAYNEAQTNEKRKFLELLHDLCAPIEDEPQTKGRPRLPLRDAVFCTTFKVYSTLSGRRFISDLCDAQAKGYIDRVPHFNSIFNYLENPAMSPILTDLIKTSSLPLRSIEKDFAVDSTGFASSRFYRWFDHKYGKQEQKHDWVKTHIACGVTTNIVTAVEIQGRYTNDQKLFPDLVNATAKNFQMREVSADKGYSSRSNSDLITSLGAEPFIMFKMDATGAKGGSFEKMFHYFSLRREEFLAHYHKRSNVESTMSMIKAKFGDAVRSKTDVAMKNEVLCKVLCHNICCVIQSMYELGIGPDFSLRSIPDDRR